MSGTTILSETPSDRRDATPRDRNAGVVVHANIEGESEFAAENRALALRLTQRQFPIQIAPLSGQHLNPQAPGLRTLGRRLKDLLHDRLDLAESVLYQSGAPAAGISTSTAGAESAAPHSAPIGFPTAGRSVATLWMSYGYPANSTAKLLPRPVSSEASFASFRTRLTPTYSAQANLPFDFHACPRSHFGF